MTSRYIVLIFLLINVITAQSSSYENYVNIYQQALQATNEKDYSKAIASYQKLLDLSSYDADTHFRIAQLQNLTGKQEESLQSLKTALELGYDFGGKLDSTLISLEQLEEFSTLNKLMAKMNTPICNSEIAYTISEKDLIPEGLAYDSVDDCFYMGSLHKYKIIRINSDGSYSDFTSEKQDGLRKLVGMKVDEKRRILWAASILNSPQQDISEDELGWSGIFKYDLNTGKLLKKYTLHVKDERHLFNDIDITANGDIYFTDSDYNSVYRILHDKDEIELFIDNEKFLYPNGITFGDDDNILYVASSGDGVYKINVSTKEYHILEQPDNISLCGIDGMYFYENSLVCVQNGLNRISRFYLTEEGNNIKSLEVLETRNPHFEIPTTGAIAGNTFYYIANSQMNKVGNGGIINSYENLKDVIILKITLNK